VLDFNMTGMDGGAVAQVLMKEHPKLPVVIWSGCLNDIPDCLKWYADVLLEKTDGPQALISAIEKLLSTSNPRKKPVARTAFGIEQTTYRVASGVSR
jgi:FixJ family two-component response regulator